MRRLLAPAGVVDAASRLAARVAAWTVLAAALISAGNALTRFAFSTSSNAWLEIQWYLFAGCVMLGAPRVLALNEHVRVDILYGKLKPRTAVWVDLFGLAVFLLPVSALLLWLSWPLFLRTLASGEMSGNAGGLVRWPAMALLPLGFALLSLQGLAEIVKRAAHLSGARTMDLHYEKPVQ